MNLLFATTNPGKLRELRSLLDGALKVVSLDELGETQEVEETGSTFAENAILKARTYAQRTGLWSLADDSGLCVDALQGAPGVHSARYAPGDDAARVRKLLEALAQTPTESRKASFVCALCLASPSEKHFVETGTCSGVILDAPRGAGGFGYDPVFYVPSKERTMAELTAEEKSAISHRGEAFARMKPRLLALARGEKLY